MPVTSTLRPRTPHILIARVLIALALFSSCSPTRNGAAPRGQSTTGPPTSSMMATTATQPTPTTMLPPSTAAVTDPDVAALPEGKGATIAIVIDDVGAGDASLGDYLALPIPLTFAVLPMARDAAAEANTIAAAGRQAILHIPLPVAPHRTAPGGLGLDATDADVAQYLDAALLRVPQAVGANNHEGSWGSATPALMARLVHGLSVRHLFFLDSVTSQRTVGFATALAAGMPARVNNVFLDNDEASVHPQLLHLARLAAQHRTAVGIGHVTHRWSLVVLQALAAQLEGRGYRFAVLDAVTNGLAGGLDAGVRTKL